MMGWPHRYFVSASGIAGSTWGELIFVLGAIAAGPVWVLFGAILAMRFFARLAWDEV